ncbi:MAG: histidine phosphatase family protein [Alphaproteobacteria bacterium]|nr:histidine phosphatase family protein [Alphaproteobacteria bacterium]
MSCVHLVRHGQASFGADDYDRLSELGWRQSRRLGEYWRERGRQFDHVVLGTLRRHDETWRGIAEGLGLASDALSTLHTPSLNEYDSAAVIETVHPDELARPDTPELYRHHFKLLREGLRLWMAGQAQPRGMPSYADFRANIAGVLDDIRRQAPGRVLVVSSGGPIATAVGLVLQTPSQATIELNFHIRNSAVSELTYNPKGHRLISYNTLNHLDSPEHQDWVTFT